MLNFYWFCCSFILLKGLYKTTNYNSVLFFTLCCGPEACRSFYVPELPQVHGTSILGINPNCQHARPGDSTLITRVRGEAANLYTNGTSSFWLFSPYNLILLERLAAALFIFVKIYLSVAVIMSLSVRTGPASWWTTSAMVSTTASMHLMNLTAVRSQIQFPNLHGDFKLIRIRCLCSITLKGGVGRGKFYGVIPFWAFAIIFQHVMRERCSTAAMVYVSPSTWCAISRINVETTQMKWTVVRNNLLL